jgi:hypothetical protein
MARARTMSNCCEMRQTRTVLTVDHIGGGYTYGAYGGDPGHEEVEESCGGGETETTTEGDTRDERTTVVSSEDAREEDEPSKKGRVTRVKKPIKPRKSEERKKQLLPHPRPALGTLRIRTLVQQRALREPDRRALVQPAAGRALRAETRQFLVQERRGVVRMVEQAAEGRLGREAAAHEHQLARRHGRERRELCRGPPARRRAE